MMNERKIFISYAHLDKDIVRQIKDYLQHNGYDCWFDDTDIRSQEHFNEEIEPAIADCTLFLAFLSRNYIDMERDYCDKEFNCAMRYRKCIMSVCIDDVTDEMAGLKRYYFSYYLGDHTFGYGEGVGDDIESYCVRMTDTFFFRIMLRGDNLPQQYTEYLQSALKSHLYRQIEDNDYALPGNLTNILYPAVTDPEMGEYIADPELADPPLIRYLQETSLSARRHVFFVGEGGMGKTASMLKACEYLLSQGKLAIYLPADELGACKSLSDYLFEYVCGENEHLMRLLKHSMADTPSNEPNVFIFLDGVNEISDRAVIETLFRKEMKNKYLRGNYDVAFFLSARYDMRGLLGMEEYFHLARFTHLTDEQLDAYLDSLSLPLITDPQLRYILRTPLMLTLYARTSIGQDETSVHVKGLSPDPHPDTPGRVIGNFFLSQLLRAAGWMDGNLADYLVLVEYVLPRLAYLAVAAGNSRQVSRDTMMKVLDEVRYPDAAFDTASAAAPSSDSRGHYAWFRSDRLCEVCDDWNVNVDSLLSYAVKTFHFLSENEESSTYGFLHQSFRDYFAAFHLSNEIRALERDPSRLSGTGSLDLEKDRYPAEIMEYLADILHEDMACPEKSTQGYRFPGKASPYQPSDFSTAEKILSLWRDKSGPHAQNAVANLLEIMRTGRYNSLASCDFSRLDLRGCEMNGCRFVEWFQDRIYPSRFDGARMDREFFVNRGHGTDITAVCAAGDGRCFSGDMEGTVRVYMEKEDAWDETLRLLPGSPVMDLAYQPGTDRLAVLYERMLFVYSFPSGKVEYTRQNRNHAQDFRYVVFGEDEKPMVSYRLEPLFRQNEEGLTQTNGLKYDVPCRTAVWHPTEKAFLRSALFQRIYAVVYDERSGAFRVHPALASREDGTGTFLSLRDFGADTGGVNALTFSPDGRRFAVGIQNRLLLFDWNTMQYLDEKKFRANVNALCWNKNGLYAGVGRHLFHLDDNLAELFVLSGTQTSPITWSLKGPDGEGFFLISRSGEIKQLDNRLQVHRIRRVNLSSQFTWAKDRRTNEMHLLFPPGKSHPNGWRYSFETDEEKLTGCNYSFQEDNLYDISREEYSHSLEHRLISVSHDPPYNSRVFTNYSGVWLFGCSFRGIQGNMAKRGNMDFIKQNGGLVDE